MCLKGVGSGRNSLLAGYESGDVVLWDLQSGKMISQLSVHNEPGVETTFEHMLGSPITNFIYSWI